MVWDAFREDEHEDPPRALLPPVGTAAAAPRVLEGARIRKPAPVIVGAHARAERVRGWTAFWPHRSGQRGHFRM